MSPLGNEWQGLRDATLKLFLARKSSLAPFDLFIRGDI